MRIASGNPKGESWQDQQVAIGRRAELAFVRARAAGEQTVAHFTAEELARCAALPKRYDDAGIGFVDASIAAMAERQRIAAIAATPPWRRAGSGSCDGPAIVVVAAWFHPA
jgi:hypothetical protein